LVLVTTQFGNSTSRIEKSTFDGIYKRRKNNTEFCLECNILLSKQVVWIASYSGFSSVYISRIYIRLYLAGLNWIYFAWYSKWVIAVELFAMWSRGKLTLWQVGTSLSFAHTKSAPLGDSWTLLATQTKVVVSATRPISAEVPRAAFWPFRDAPRA